MMINFLVSHIYFDYCFVLGLATFSNVYNMKTTTSAETPEARSLRPFCSVVVYCCRGCCEAAAAVSSTTHNAQWGIS